MLKKLLNLFNYNKPLIEKIEWKVTNEPDVLHWSKRGIADGGKNLKIKKYFCYSFVSILLLGILFIFIIPVFKEVEGSILLKLVISVLLILFLMPFVAIPYFGILEIKYYSYHITDKEIELTSWKEDLLLGKQFAKGIICIATPFLVIVFITEPSALLVSLGGMAGVGILAGATLFSKGYIERHLNYEHLFTHLDTIEKLKIDKSRKLILLVAKNFNHKKQQSRIFNLFCTEENFNQLVQLVTEKATINNVEVIYGQAYAPN